MNRSESSNLEYSSAQALTIEERENIRTRASLRHLRTEMRRRLLELSSRKEAHVLGSYQQGIMATISREMEGQPSDDLTVDELSSSALALEQQAKEVEDKLPNLAAFRYAKAAKLKQSAGLPFGESLELAREFIEKSSTLPKNSPNALLPEAMIIGIQTQSAKELPDVDPVKVADEISKDKELLADYALVLSEDQRQEFIDLLPGEKRAVVAALMDRALSQELKHEKILTPADKKQKESVTHRSYNEIATRLGQAGIERPLIKVLSQTLSQLASDEAKQLLKEVSITSVEQGENPASDRSRFSVAARLIKSLSDLDNLAGGALAMKLLGNPDLPSRYFRFFRNYLHKNEFLGKNLDQVGNWSEDQCKRLFNFLKEGGPEWKDEANVGRPFEQGAAIFGYKNMFVYAGRPDVSRHDALFAFNKILDLYRASGMSPNQFYGNVLTQVHLDDSTYENGTAYHAINEIAESLDVTERNLSGLQAKIERYPNIEKLRGLAQYFSNPKQIFSSWGSLRKFSELTQLLEQAEILEELEELKQQALSDKKKAKLYQFIEMLAFHTGSKVDMKAVLEFWQDPNTFFERPDDHTPRELHEAIRPSNYTDIRFLDLQPADLRDALVDGSLDKIQAFPPMEIIYSTSRDKSLQVDLSFHDELVRQVGSRLQGNANTVLFNEVRKLLKPTGIDTVAYLQGKTDEFENLPASQQQSLQQQIREAILLYPNKNLKNETSPRAGKYRAKVNYKSDPQAVLAGNDTACCMPFGSGKNNVYMFNPTCALFTLEEQRGTGWRTIAQSVLTLDQDIKKNIPEIAEAAEEGFAGMTKVLPEATADQNKRYLSCDNIEVAANFTSMAKLIEAIYADFFSQYSTYYNEQSSRALDNGKVIIGKGNSDLTFGTQEENRYLPTSLIGYSDKLGSQVDVIRFNDRGSSEVVLTQDSVNRLDGSDAPNSREHESGVLPLFCQDSLAVAYIESKAYPAAMAEGLPTLQNYIIASEINNQAKKRPTLSSKYVDRQGKMQGYLLAYEGKDESDRPIIYIEDLAADPSSRLAGGRLINGFLDTYKANYLDHDSLTPIFLQARDETSWQILVQNIERLSERIGIKYEMEELNEYNYGGSTMHAVKLTPIKR